MTPRCFPVTLLSFCQSESHLLCVFQPTNAQYVLEIVSQTYSGAFGFTPDSQVSGNQFFYLTVQNFQYLDYDNSQYRSQTVTVGAGCSFLLQYRHKL